MKPLIVKREYKKSQEFDEGFFCEENYDSNSDSGYQLDDKFLGKYLSEKKINIFLVIIFAALAGLLLRTVQLQIVRGDYYKNLAETNRTREKALISARGLIYDRNYQPLVKNDPIFNAFVLPRDLSLDDSKRKEQIQLISQVIKQPEEKILEVLDKQPRNFKYLLLVRENIDYEEALLLKIRAQNVAGLYIETGNQREYLEPVDFSHLLGYLGKITEEEFAQKKEEYLLNDYIGKTGLELTYEDVLRGKYGKDRVEVDVTGQEKKTIYHQEAISGKSLVLSIDKNMQKKVREILQDDLKKINKDRASVVILNPKNGEVLALVSLPDFDNNLFAHGISTEDYKKLLDNENNPLFDRSIKGEYPSGSTIKPLVAAGGLQEGIVTDKTSFMSTGGLMLYDRWWFPDWSAGGHGQTNVYKAISWSVNTYFYIVGGGYEDFQGLGENGLKKYYELFGLGQKTGLDLIGEKGGLVPDPEWKKKVKNEDWYIGDTYHMAIGQGDVLVTPLQVANYTAVFANGGTLFKPHLVKEIMSNDGEKQVIEPQIIRQSFIDQKNLNIVKAAMHQTVTSGSAQYLDNLPVSSGGKTGTAQWHSEKDNHAWYTGFAPYEDPQIVITVLVEEGGEGSQVSVPITYDILNWYFSEYLNNQ